MKKYIKPEIRQIDLELNCVINNGSNGASTESVRWGGRSFSFSDSDEPETDK